jgi:hypothetical protein
MAEIAAPDNGVKIRIYRQGHGDCFLLTMCKEGGEPFHLLIDCGLWTNSEIKATVEEVIDDIVDATGGHLDVLVITHEHMDHVNMFSARLGTDWLWDRITIDQLWVGWTANRKDSYAKKIREKHEQAVNRLVAYVNRIRLRAGPGMSELASELDDLLAFEGIEPPAGFAAASDYVPLVHSDATMDSKTSVAMDYLFGRVGDSGRTYFKPHEQARTIPGVPGIRVFALGPPRDEDRLDEEEPEAALSDRLYKKTGALEGILGAAGNEVAPDADPFRPFAKGFERTRKSGTAGEKAFFRHFLPSDDKDWRAVENDWLFSLAWFARKINVHINNTSLVLAFELEQSGKVLLFAGDAQYGNWITWADKKLVREDDTELPVNELLARTVFYKTGHHGSHNATLKGEPESDYANLSWLGQGDYERDFVAVIPANERWATKVKKWPHPLKSIHTALMDKANGRVFQSNVDFSQMGRSGGAAADWDSFVNRSNEDPGKKLYFDYWIPDE